MKPTLILVLTLCSFHVASSQEATTQFHDDFNAMADLFEKELLGVAKQLAEKQHKPLGENPNQIAKLVQDQLVRTAVIIQDAQLREIRDVVSKSLWNLKVHVDYTADKKKIIFEKFHETYRLFFIYLDYQFFERMEKAIFPGQ